MRVTWPTLLPSKCSVVLVQVCGLPMQHKAGKHIRLALQLTLVLHCSAMQCSCPILVPTHFRIGIPPGRAHVGRLNYNQLTVEFDLSFHLNGLSTKQKIYQNNNNIVLTVPHSLPPMMLSPVAHFMGRHHAVTIPSDITTPHINMYTYMCSLELSCLVLLWHIYAQCALHM